MKKISKFFLLLILLVAGVGHVWSDTKGLVASSNIYFDNSCGWTDNYFKLGTIQSNGYISMTSAVAKGSPISNTKLYKLSGSGFSSWSLASYYMIGCANSSDWGNQTGSWSTITTYAAMYSNKVSTPSLSSSNYWVLSPASNSKGSALTVTNAGTSYSGLNMKQTVKVMISTNGGSSYTEAAQYYGTIKASRYTMASATTTSSSTKTLADNDSYASGVLTSSITFTASETSTGYSFMGWGEASSATPDGEESKTYTVSGEKTIYAFYKLNSYAVNFSGSNFTPSFTSGTEKAYGSTVEFTLEAAQDYAIDKVTSDQVTINNNNDTYSFTMPASAVTVNVSTYSTKVTTYTIRFLNSDETVLQTGKVEENTMPVYNGSTPTKEATAEFTFTFAGWDKEIVEATEDADYTATYNSTRVQYTLTWAGIEGATVEGGTAAGLVANASPITAPTVTKTGYTFDGWNPEVPATMPAVNSTYTAQLNPITYSITYDVPAGATNPNTATSYTIESATITLQAASMTGKKFNGWFSDAEYTQQVTEIAQGSTGNKTLFASFSDLDPMYFINRPNWSGTIYSYNWGSSHEATWPGSAMTKQDGKIWSGSSSYDYYSHYYNESYPNCIFNNNSSQTADLTGQANKYFLPASSSNKMSGSWVDVFALSYGKSEYGTLVLKSGSTTIAPAAGDKVVSGNSITFTATPDANCHIVGWFSDAEFTTPIPETGTETTYELTISAAASVYVQFAEDTDPSVTLALSANTIKVGESVTFTPTAYKTDGSETYTYYVNDSAIANATFTPETKGTYSCKVVMHYADADYTSNVENLTVTGTCRLYYSNPDNWATVKAYLWQNSNTSNNNSWPGEAITENTEVINNRTYYYYDVDESKNWDRIIFNNGSGSQTSDITFSDANCGQYNNAPASSAGTWQNLPEPIDPETPYTTVKVLCDYSSNVKIFFLNKSEDFMVKDAEEIGTSSEYLMNALGEQTIDEKTGYLYEVSFYGTTKMAIFVSNSHIGTNNKLTSQDVDLTKAARVTYYYDLTGVTAGSPETNIFTKIWVPLTQGYGTFCYPQAVQVSQAVPFWMQIEENTEEESGYELVMTAMEDNILPANTGALIYSKQKNAQAILTVVESSVLYEDNDFEGTTERTAIPNDLGEGEKVYVLGNRTAGIAFYDYQPTSGYIPAYKAYFRLTPKEEPQGAPSRVKMTFRTEPASPTGTESATYNLQPATSKMLRNGQLIIIRDGQKFNAQGTRL